MHNIFIIENKYILYLFCLDDLGKMQELSLITTDNAYYTCLGNYDPIKDDPIPENSKSKLEVSF